MNRHPCAAISGLAFAIVAIFAGSMQIQGQDTKPKYPSMASVDQYLMPDRNAEIELARSAAPESISREARILILGRHGYETAFEGKNGFVCVVERAWMSPFDSAEFWNPKLRGPVCFNPPAARSILPITYKKTEMALAGRAKTEIAELTKAAYARKELPALEPGAMAYMMSKEAYLTDAGSHNLAHLMFWIPPTDGADWGADLPNSPVSLLQKGPPEPFTLFMVPVGKWSDGTHAPLPK
jgi:hypothetical protein